jgi:hypothetical protein
MQLPNLDRDSLVGFASNHKVELTRMFGVVSHGMGCLLAVMAIPVNGGNVFGDDKVNKIENLAKAYGISYYEMKCLEAGFEGWSHYDENHPMWRLGAAVRESVGA